MFKKKPQIKPLSPLRSSDRRKIADQIIADLGIAKSTPENATEEEKTAATAEHTALRNALLPDNALSARFTTTHGPNLKQISGTVYVGEYEGGDQRILWFKINDRMYPTVYTLWRNPAIIPLIHTHPFVMEKLQGGADLMTPGLTYGPPFPVKAKKDAIVAVADTGRPTVPMMVGTCEIDVSQLQQVQGAKGHAVENVHWAGDELWSWSASSKAGVSPPHGIAGWERPTDKPDEEDLATGTEKLQLDHDGEDEGGVSLVEDTQEQPTVDSTAADHQALNGDEESPTKDVGREFSTKEIDEAFRKAFLYGVHHHVKTQSGPTYGLTFPLNQSFVTSNLVQPFLPAFTPEEAAQLQIKKSSFKNIKKFIRSLDKEQIIKSKERDGNEVVIFDIDFNDRAIKDFVPYRLPKKETAAGTSAGRGDLATIAPGKSSTGPLKIHLIYKPKDKLTPLFESAKADPRSFYSQTDISNIVSTYVTTENLVAPTNKRIVKLDPILANTIFDKPNSAQDKEILARGTCPRETLNTRVLEHCALYHQISTAGAEPGKPKAGPPPKILITLETRSGNKTVTKVSGLEAFGIEPQPLADELRKVCAGSTSVEKLVGSSVKAPVMEVMVQGPQKDAVTKALEKRGVDKRWVEVLDKVKKKK